MAEPNNDRIIFPKGGQRRFITNVQKKLDWKISEISKLLKVSSRTITDWKREKFLISEKYIFLLAKKADLHLPKNLKKKDRFWYTKKGASKGGTAVYEKYGRVGGDPLVRKERWFSWWNQKGKFNNYKIFRPLPFSEPKQSRELAEFFGIMMGDGGITHHQITVTLHHKDDLLYSKFVARLMKKLFGVTPSVYHIPKYSVNNIVISRSGIVKYLHTHGLPIGNKIRQQFDMPPWIKKNISYQIACIRGLVDTDGSVFTHRYRVNNKQYAYKKLSFTTMSKPLHKSVYGALKRAGLKPRIAQKGRDIRLDSREEMKKYFRIVGSNNPKHLKRYLN